MKKLSTNWINGQDPMALASAFERGRAERPGDHKVHRLTPGTPLRPDKHVVLPDGIGLTVAALRVRTRLVELDFTPLEGDLVAHPPTEGFVFLHSRPEQVGMHVTRLEQVDGGLALVDQVVADQPVVDYTPALWALAAKESVHIVTPRLDGNPVIR